MSKRLCDESGGGGIALTHQFDRLRRDIAKNQFIVLNEKKMKSRQKKNCNTILEISNDEEKTKIEQES